MIVRRVGDRLQLITQPDHARLAGRIMAHCAPLARHPRRAAILRAIAGHDNGWAEEDASPQVNPETGAVVDFITAPLAIRHEVWRRGVARLAAEPWVAALVAQHAITVYDRFRNDREWDSFFSHMQALRNNLLREGDLPLDELLKDYVFVRLGDLISLTFCTGWRDEQRFAEWKVQLSGNCVRVSPGSFGAEAVPIEIEARLIPNRVFHSQADLMSALADDATPVALIGEVRATPS